jgi:hypothetical protein
LYPTQYSTAEAVTGKMTARITSPTSKRFMTSSPFLGW